MSLQYVKNESGMWLHIQYDAKIMKSASYSITKCSVEVVRMLIREPSIPHEPDDFNIGMSL